jgi:hypothetical protein
MIYDIHYNDATKSIVFPFFSIVRFDVQFNFQK